MKAKIFLILQLTLLHVLILMAALIFIFKANWFSRDIYLEGFDKTGEKQSGEVATFLADASENYALYQTSNASKISDIDDAKFYGDIESYDYAPLSDYRLDQWNNDLNIFQWVIKTKRDFDELTVGIENYDDLVKNGVDISYGFADFTYASYSELSGISNPYGISEPLLVPDRMSDKKQIYSVKANKVYVVYFVLTTKTLTSETPSEVELELSNSSNILKNQKVILSNEVDLKVDDKGNDFNIFSFPEWSAYYYNNKLKNPGDGESLIPTDFQTWKEAQNLETTVDDAYDVSNYIIYNSKKYWEAEFSYTSSKLGSDWFQLNTVNQLNSNYQRRAYSERFHTNSPWDAYRKDLNFFNWEYKGEIEDDKFLTDSKISDEDFKKWMTSHISIDESNFDRFDQYITFAYSQGLRKGMLNSIQGSWNSMGGMDIYSYREHKFISTNSGVATPQGRTYLKWWLNKFKDHIDKVLKILPEDNETRKAYEAIDFYYYLDEKASSTVRDTNNILKEFDKDKKYIHFAFSDWDQDVDFDVSVENNYDFADFAWVHTLDYYNRDYNAINKFIQKRKSINLTTGIYSLDSDSTFNLPRAEPGIFPYIQMALELNDSPSYMKYLMNGWYSEDNYWTTDFVDQPWVDNRYVSGDTMWSYPTYRDVVDYQKIHSMNKEGELSAISFTPSIRLLELAYGKKLIGKIQYFESQNEVTKSYLEENVNKNLKLGKKLSSTKFDLNYDKTNFDRDISGKKPTFTEKWMSYKNYDEITGYKNVRNMISWLSKYGRGKE